MPSDQRRAPPPPGRLRRLDARLKLLLLLAACFCTQYLPLAWLPAWLLLLQTLFLQRELRTAGVTAMVRGGVIFVLFWLLFKAGADALWGIDWRESLLGGLPLAVRLLCLVLIGTVHVGLSSPLETGSAVAWCLRPLAGERAWKPALAVALTAWFLPQTLRLAGRILEAARARGLRLPWHRKALLVVGTSLRLLEARARELAVGLASRRLDDGRSWGRF